MLLNRDRALEIMDAHHLDALVAAMPENVYYLSDYGTYRSFTFSFLGVSAAILPRDESIAPTLIVYEFEMPHMGASPSWMPELRVVSGGGRYGAVAGDGTLTEGETRIRELYHQGGAGEFTTRNPLLARTLTEMGLADKRLGIDDLRVMQEMGEKLPAATLVDALDTLREIRLIKTPDEITLLRQAARINAAALTTTANLVVEGITTGELVRNYKIAMAAQDGVGSHITGGGDGHPWPGHPNLSYRLKEGDILHLDAAGSYRRYWADIGRSAYVGEPTQKFVERYAALQESHRILDPDLRPGNSSSRMIERAREIVPRALPVDGLLPIVHSIGVEQWERVDEYFVFEKGMVIAFETVYFELGWGALQLEDMYLIGDDGPERLGGLAQEPYVKTPRVPAARGH